MLTDNSPCPSTSSAVPEFVQKFQFNDLKQKYNMMFREIAETQEKILIRIENLEINQVDTLQQ